MNKKWLIISSISFSVGLTLNVIISRNIKQAALTGLLSVPATTVAVLVIESQRKRKLVDDISKLETELNELRIQLDAGESNKKNLEKAISSLEAHFQKLTKQEPQLKQSLKVVCDAKQKLEISLEGNRARYNQLQQKKSDLENAIATISTNKNDLEKQLEEQKQQLTVETHHLQEGIEILRQEIIVEKKALVEVKIKKEQTAANLIRLEEKCNLIQNQIDSEEVGKLKLERELTKLDLEKSSLQIFTSNLNTEVAQLKQQKNNLNQFLTNLTQEQHEQESNCNKLRSQLEQLHNSIGEQEHFKKQLEAESENLAKQKQDLIVQVQQLQSLVERQIKLNEIEQESEKENGTEIPTLDPIFDETEEESKPLVYSDNNNDDFRNANYTKHLWETAIFPYWNHRESPVGYRFLGNVTIESNQSDRLIDIVGKNLQRLDRITDNSLQQSFSALEKDWIKIITFALSEYAYYYSDERFWEGFCDRINIEHNQTVENTLRQVTEQGIDLLGLIRAGGGYKYVSTLWLQSGVPKHNLGHFATIVQDVADEYGWWEISHSSVKDIAEELWKCWENKYSQWGTIRHFLNLDNSNEDIEPISGQLVKNIAIVAKELERQNISPITLQSKKAREELLNNTNLSYSFFLRDWSDLITVLTPREGGRDRSIAKRRNKPPYLYLDVADTLNTLLILPEQSLWKKEWQNLRGTYCLIPEADWEDNMPSQGNLEIPELEIDIKQPADEWSCQLQNHHRNNIYQWEHEGVNSEFPCLVFDAISGEHIQINLPNPKIIGIEEIILFTPREVNTEVDNNIEVIDSSVPSSIKGWRGKEIRLIESKASIHIRDVKISWQLREQEQPQLIGLRLKGKKVVYLNAPTLCYPPQVEELTINYLIENIDRKNIIAKDYLVIPINNKWTEINLSQWITKSGNYQATFWQQQKQWSYRFEVREEYHISQKQGYSDLKVYDRDNNRLSTTAKYDNIDRFWAEQIKIDNLYPLEELTFRLKSDYEEYTFQTQANSLGKLTLSLASLYSCLLPSDHYSLDFKQSGSEFRRILQVGSFITWRMTATEIIFEGLPVEDNYYLSGWNLLRPDREPEVINFSSSNLEQTIVALSFSPGIYQVQLNREHQLIENIGLWCGIDTQNIPDEILDDESLANYCYTILDNEPVEDFFNALKQLNTNFNTETIQIILNNLHQENYYLPEWLDQESFNKKIQVILENLLSSESNSNIQQELNKENMEITNQVTTISGQWCLLTVRQWKRETFLRCLDNDIQSKQLQELMLEIIAPEESVYQDIVLIRISNFSEARSHLQQIENFQGIQRLKPNEVSRMLNR